jgi:hypothetical protein
VARELKNSNYMELSAQTVRPALKEAGIKAMVKKPRLLPRRIRSVIALQY